MGKRDSVLVTGVAGFIGSHLAERLVRNYNVIGVDCFTDYYAVRTKERNLHNLLLKPNFQLIRTDLSQSDLRKLDVDYVFHLAGQPGVRASWGTEFDSYVKDNILATQKLLESFLDSHLKKFVFASSSSVYGDTNNLPIAEGEPLRPLSPYGVTKLAAENLCTLYYKNYGLPTVSLRYFTVYGPRQRPDMGVSRFIRSVLRKKEIAIYGDGTQTRDLTFVSDAVAANVLAAESNVKGEVFNIAGGSRINLLDLITLIEKIARRKAIKNFVGKQKGDVAHTWASTKKAQEMLGYSPRVPLEEGLKQQVKWEIENIARTEGLE